MARWLFACLFLACVATHAQTVVIHSVTVDDLGTSPDSSDDKITISFSVYNLASTSCKVNVYHPSFLSTPFATIDSLNTSSSNPRSVSIPRIDPTSSFDRIFSALSVGARLASGAFLFSGPPQFVTQYNLTGRDESPPPIRLTKKGHLDDDAVPIDTNGFGSQHILMNLDYGALVRTSPPHISQANNFIRRDYEGTAYYYSKCYLSGRPTLGDGSCDTGWTSEYFREEYVYAHADRGAAIYLYLLLYPDHSLDSPFEALKHPKNSPVTVNGVTPTGLSAFNTTNIAGARKFRAVTEFLANRYKGKISGYVVGNEINLHYYWYNRGVLKNSSGTPLDGPAYKAEALDTLLSDYSRTLRMAHTAVRKHSRNARVYTSLTTYWANYYNPTAPPNTWSQFAPSKDFIDVLNTKIKAGGDIDWHLLYKTFARYSISGGGYPLGGPWNDDVDFMGNYWLWENDNAKWKACYAGTDSDCNYSSSVSSNPRWIATGDYNTSPFITARNIAILPNYFKRPALMYNGTTPRSIIIGDIGFASCLYVYDNDLQRCATPTEDTLFSVREDYMAAAVAYQYHKIANLDGIDAWTYYRRLDDGAKLTSGDRLGLGYLIYDQNGDALRNASGTQFLINKRKAWDIYAHANRLEWKKHFDKVLYVFSDTQHSKLQLPAYARQDLTSWSAVLEGHPSSGMHYINNFLAPAILVPLLLP